MIVQKLKRYSLIISYMICVLLCANIANARYDSFGAHQTFIQSQGWPIPLDVCQGSFANPFDLGMVDLPGKVGKSSSVGPQSQYLMAQVQSFAVRGTTKAGEKFATTSLGMALGKNMAAGAKVFTAGVNVALGAANGEATGILQGGPLESMLMGMTLCPWSWAFYPNEYMMWQRNGQGLVLESDADDVYTMEVDPSKIRNVNSILGRVNTSVTDVAVAAEEIVGSAEDAINGTNSSSSAYQVISKSQVPYYYHCDPMYNPDTNTQLDLSEKEEALLVGRTRGYEGFSGLCDDSVIIDGRTNASFADKSKISAITIGFHNPIVAYFMFVMGHWYPNGARGEQQLLASITCSTTLEPGKKPNANAGSLFPGVALWSCTPMWAYTVALAWGALKTLKNFTKWKPIPPKIPSPSAIAQGAAIELAQFIYWTAKYMQNIKLTAYYKMDNQSGGIRVCAANVGGIIPLEIGCAPTAPPAETISIPNYYFETFGKTRCMYLLTPRLDLRNVGGNLASVNLANKPDDANSIISVKRFLNSDMHFLSNTVGCVHDMLIRFIVPISETAESPYSQMQKRIEGIMAVILTLAVSLFGIKMLTSPEPLKKSDMIMFLLKLSIVIYFVLGKGWYNKSDQSPGLFPYILEAPAVIADIFLQSQAKNEPTHSCYLKGGMLQSNILGENYFNVNIESTNLYKHFTMQDSTDGIVSNSPSSSAVKPYPGYYGTYGYGTQANPYIKMTVWDLLDCKLANYLNMGSCDYTWQGMLAIFLFIPALFTFNLTFILFAFMSFIYAFFILLTLVKFAHIFILSIITITILIFVSPIFMAMMLFDRTKSIYDKWVRVVFGYMLYPAMMFAFLALIFSTFDSIMYGDLITLKNQEANTNVNFANLCKQVTNSTYCVVLDIVNSHYNTEGRGMCESVVGSARGAFLGSKKIIILSVSHTRLSSDDWKVLSIALFKMLLFSFLFYTFLTKISNFCASLAGVAGKGMDDKAYGSLNVISAKSRQNYKKAGSAMKKGAASGASKLGKEAQKRNMPALAGAMNKAAELLGKKNESKDDSKGEKKS